MTKMLTCTCALQLFEKGYYLMSDPISKYLPEFKKIRITYNELNTENASKITSGGLTGESIKNSGNGYAQNPITIKDLFTMSARLDYDLNSVGIKKHYLPVKHLHGNWSEQCLKLFLDLNQEQNLDIAFAMMYWEH